MKERWFNHSLVLKLAAGLAGLVVMAHAAGRWSLPWPHCGLKTLTGLPCPFCGGTRAILALSHLDFHQAVKLNPLVFLGCLAVAGGCVSLLADEVLHRSLTETVVHRLRQIPSPWAYGAVFLNWIYVILS